ncbi:hypothetical protein CFC21_109364 [Triticum aestivum]|uniref:Uncharacterized protein n=4 Tax=Triticum aestivum TaxID=4565 RepID=A0A9R1MKJ0_WHEAT|nr:hypothetical protein CFC21_109364 [Triticum aestivum]
MDTALKHHQCYVEALSPASSTMDAELNDKSMLRCSSLSGKQRHVCCGEASSPASSTIDDALKHRRCYVEASSPAGNAMDAALKLTRRSTIETPETALFTQHDSVSSNSGSMLHHSGARQHPVLRRSVGSRGLKFHHSTDGSAWDSTTLPHYIQSTALPRVDPILLSPTSPPASPPQAPQPATSPLTATPLSSPPLVADPATTVVWAGGVNALLSAAELLPPGHPDPSVACSPPAASSPSTQSTEDGGRSRYTLVLAWPQLHKAMLDPAGAEPFARAYAGVPAYAYYDQDREANEVMLDDEHRLEDILVGDAPLR